jgi:hypothetical protein
VTCVLIGEKTWERKYVRYEIEQSIERGNGILGIHINRIKNQKGWTCFKGRVPGKLVSLRAPIYSWDRAQFGNWVEEAARVALSEVRRPKTFFELLFG